MLAEDWLLYNIVTVQSFNGGGGTKCNYNLKALLSFAIVASSLRVN